MGLRYNVWGCVTVSHAALQCVGLRCIVFVKNMNYLGHLKTSRTSDKVGGSPPVLL